MPEDTTDRYTRPRVPPATPPVIDPNVQPLDASELVRDDGDSEHEGSRQAAIERGKEDEEIRPDDSPDEIAPDTGDTVRPTSPAEIEIERGDTDEPGKLPDGGSPEIQMPPD